MAKGAGFVNPTVKKSIETVAGTAYYQQTEIEDILGRWNDIYYTRDGYYVIHEGNQHHVYKVPPKCKVSAGVKSPHIAGGKYQFQGKGWREAPDHTGKAPIHKEVATRAQARKTNNTPMTRQQKELRLRLIHEHQYHNPETGLVDWKPNTPEYIKDLEKDIATEQMQGTQQEHFQTLIEQAKMVGVGNVNDWISRYNDPKRSKDNTILDLESLITVIKKRKQSRKGKYGHSPPYRVDVWEERDRLIITVYDKNDREVISWVDEDARQMFEDGFFNSRYLEQSVLDYLKDMKIKED